MTRWVALLRGVNAGRAKRVAMADLRAVLEGLGYGGVRTLLTSGNAVFDAPGDEPTIAAAVESALAAQLGLESAVLVRSSADLDALVAANPLAGRADPTALHCLFVAGPVPDLGLAPADIAPDEAVAGDRCVYLRLPDGVMASRLPDLAKRLDVPVTQRTWGTVLKLQAAASA